jgi:uncharacterized protein YdhG (YjbR/CyaY superfamily)
MFEDIDSYIRSFPETTRALLREIRNTIKKAAPEAREAIKYGMPTFVFHGNLVHFAAFKNHIGFYPVPSAIGAFRKELSAYKSGKGSVQFLLDKPIPLALITKIVKFRVAENLNRTKLKRHS